MNKWACTRTHKEKNAGEGNINKGENHIYKIDRSENGNEWSDTRTTTRSHTQKEKREGEWNVKERWKSGFSFKRLHEILESAEFLGHPRFTSRWQIIRGS